MDDGQNRSGGITLMKLEQKNVEKLPYSIILFIKFRSFGFYSASSANFRFLSQCDLIILFLCVNVRMFIP